jgi:thiol-disulfide isomerase/thioredoxin
MKKLFALLVAALVVLALPSQLPSADAPDAKAALKDLIGKVNTKLKDDQRTEAALAAELKEFDALLEKHKGAPADDLAQILLMKAMLYIQVFEDEDKGVPMLKQLKESYPESKQAKSVDQILASMEKQAEAKKIQRSLVAGTKFPDFSEADLNGQPLSVAKFKGKVVLIDFWATWCGPCIAELPNLKQAYEQYHPKGFEIIGISLDSDKGKLTGFLEKEKMTWPQYFDGLGWKSKLGQQYGVNSIPATYLLDGEGNIVAKNLRGAALEKELAKLLGK